MPLEDFLDCCSAPKLETTRTIAESSHDSQDLKRCRTCGAYWFYRFHEHVDFSGGDDSITVWYSPLTPVEAVRILQTAGRPDLAFLEQRATIVEDEQGVRRTTGQPSTPGPW